MFKKKYLITVILCSMVFWRLGVFAKDGDPVIEGLAATGNIITSGNMGAGDTTPDASLEVVDSLMVSSVEGNDGDNLRVTATGEVLKSNNPAFLVYNSSTDENITGDGTAATVDLDTEVFDQGNNFTADTFTAPVTGRYILTGNVLLLDLGSDTYETMYIKIATSNRNYLSGYSNPENVKNSSNSAHLNISVLADMDAADTATLIVYVFDGTKTVDVYGSASMHTYFSGYLAN